MYKKIKSVRGKIKESGGGKGCQREGGGRKGEGKVKEKKGK